MSHTSHEFDPEVKRLKSLFASNAKIDESGVVTYGNLTFEQTLPDGLTADHVASALSHFSKSAVANAAVVGELGVPFCRENKSIEIVTSEFSGPGTSSLKVSYKDRSQVPNSKDGTTGEYRGSVSASWVKLAGPGGKDFDAVKAAVHAAAIANQ